jgi:hypothetical protein
MPNESMISNMTLTVFIVICDASRHNDSHCSFQEQRSVDEEPFDAPIVLGPHDSGESCASISYEEESENVQ